MALDLRTPMVNPEVNVVIVVVVAATSNGTMNANDLGRIFILVTISLEYCASYPLDFLLSLFPDVSRHGGCSRDSVFHNAQESSRKRRRLELFV